MGTAARQNVLQRIAGDVTVGLTWVLFSAKTGKVCWYDTVVVKRTRFQEHGSESLRQELLSRSRHRGQRSGVLSVFGPETSDRDALPPFACPCLTAANHCTHTVELLVTDGCSEGAAEDVTDFLTRWAQCTAHDQQDYLIFAAAEKLFGKDRLGQALREERFAELQRRSEALRGSPRKGVRECCDQLISMRKRRLRLAAAHELWLRVAMLSKALDKGLQAATIVLLSRSMAEGQDVGEVLRNALREWKKARDYNDAYDDVWERIRKLSHCGEEGVLTAVLNMSRVALSFFASAASESITSLRHFLDGVDRQIRTERTDLVVPQGQRPLFAVLSRYADLVNSNGTMLLLSRKNVGDLEKMTGRLLTFMEQTLDGPEGDEDALLRSFLLWDPFRTDWLQHSYLERLALTGDVGPLFDERSDGDPPPTADGTRTLSLFSHAWNDRLTLSDLEEPASASLFPNGGLLHHCSRHSLLSSLSTALKAPAPATDSRVPFGDYRDHTCLHVAAQDGDLGAHRHLATPEALRCITRLRDNGANPQLCDAQGRTAKAIVCDRLLGFDDSNAALRFAAELASAPLDGTGSKNPDGDGGDSGGSGDRGDGREERK